MVITPSSHPLITEPWPILKLNGSWPASFVLQNFLARSLSFPKPVQWTVTFWPLTGLGPVPAFRIVFSKPILSSSSSSPPASPTLAELAALAGYDYVVVDMEHGPGGVPEALACLRALDAARTPAVIRLPEAGPIWAKKALDLGPAGLMVPAVESPAAAAAAVSHCRYPPRGVRGAAHPIVRASAYGLDDSYLSRCEDETLIICQVETAAGIAEVDAIAAVDGVDVVQMGPLDLSASMGYLWDPGNRKVRARLREAEKKVLDARKKNVTASDGNVAYLGGFAMPNDPAEQLKLRGYHMVSGAVDIGMFRKAALEDVKRFKEAVMEIGEEEGEEDDEKDKEDDGYWSE